MVANGSGDAGGLVAIGGVTDDVRDRTVGAGGLQCTGPVDAASATELSDRRTRRTGLRQVSMRDWVLSVNGERLFLKGASQGPARAALARISLADDRFV
jgi:hypothetical protein